MFLAWLLHARTAKNTSAGREKTLLRTCHLLLLLAKPSTARTERRRRHKHDKHLMLLRPDVEGLGVNFGEKNNGPTMLTTAMAKSGLGT